MLGATGCRGAANEASGSARFAPAETSSLPGPACQRLALGFFPIEQFGKRQQRPHQFRRLDNAGRPLHRLRDDQARHFALNLNSRQCGAAKDPTYEDRLKRAFWPPARRNQFTLARLSIRRPIVGSLTSSPSLRATCRLLITNITSSSWSTATVVIDHGERILRRRNRSAAAVIPASNSKFVCTTSGCKTIRASRQRSLAAKEPALQKSGISKYRVSSKHGSTLD
ncbi:hypothetical protein ACVIHD_002552 [Bradyrhizobium embrapense]